MEYDLSAGQRGQRLAPLVARLAALCGAQSAVMVNNNAAALLLILNGLARDREVIVSRSQLIEIGGSFRLPDVMAASGCRLVEVGCTNRCHIDDYRDAITGETAAILVAHQSNFRIIGFTTSPELDELARLAHSYELPLVVDQGSGALYDLRRWQLSPEPTVAELLTAGVDLVCFSGDKLLGGPQAGVIVGSAARVEPLAKHPLYRALRPDKAALVVMDHVLCAHADGRFHDIPLYVMLETPVEVLTRRARALGRRLRAQGIAARGGATRAVLGGGTTPSESLPSYGLFVGGGAALEAALRAQPIPVVARIEDDEVVLDMRTVLSGQERELEESVVAAYGAVHDTTIARSPSGR